MVVEEQNKNKEGQISLDVKDRKILYHLSQDARQGYTQLAKKVALSKNAVKYRVERLREEGVITNFVCSINFGAIGFDTFAMLLKFNSDIYVEKGIVNYFKEHEFADSVEILSGDWDMFVEFVIKDLNHVHEIANNIINKFGDGLNCYETFFSHDFIKVDSVLSDIYKGLSLQVPEKKDRIVKECKIDLIDKKILNLIAINSDLTFPEIADKLGLTLDVVRYRMKNLIKNEVILDFFPKVSMIKLGYSQYLGLIRLKDLSKERLRAIKQKIRMNKNINYSFFDVLSSNLVFICAFNSGEQADSLFRGLRSEFRDIIEKQNYLIIKEQVLFNLFPKGLVK